MALAPICTVVEQICGKPEYKQPYTRAYFNWAHLLQVIDPRQGKFNQAKFDELQSALSEAQSYSISLLREWWDGRIQEPELSKKAAAAILNAAMTPLLTDLEIKDLPASTREFVTSFKGDGLLDDPGDTESSYHSALLILWKTEFVTFGENMIDQNLYSTRRWAATAATAQRISWSCFEPALQGAEGISCSSGQDQRKFKHPLRSTIAPCPWLGLHEKKRAVQNGMDGLPYYLWDVKQQRTIEVNTLTHRPRYIAVSHTWGRWMLQDEPPVNIENIPWPVPRNSRFDVSALPHRLSQIISTTPYLWIDLFCIPQDKADPKLSKIMNEEIARQGEIFVNANGAMIWFNEVEDWIGLEDAVLWYAAKFLQESRSSSTKGTAEIEPWLQVFEKESNQPTQLFEKYEYTGRESVQAAKPSGWFSSLWTLQEICLRPDMLLVDRNWRLFAVGPKNLIVTIDNLIALEQCLQVHKHMSTPVEIKEDDLKNLGEGSLVGGEQLEDGDMSKFDPLPLPDEYKRPPMPQGPTELAVLLGHFEMDQLLDASPATILALANQRYCKRSRAQAIMSVIGATKWFKSHVAKSDTVAKADNLVLGRYSFEFVKEVRKNLGAQFFCSLGSGVEICPKDIYERGPDSKITGLKAIGSLMPFAASDNRPKRAFKYPEASKDHPSVASWEIFPDGTCGISQASILSSFRPASPSTTPSNSPPLRARLFLHYCDANNPGVKDGELHEILREYSPRFNIYAVVLCHGNTTRDCCGVILQEVILPGGTDHPGVLDKTTSISRYEPPTRLLLRVGFWRLWDWKKAPEIPSSTDVDWRVL